MPLQSPPPGRAACLPRSRRRRWLSAARAQAAAPAPPSSRAATLLPRQQSGATARSSLRQRARQAGAPGKRSLARSAAPSQQWSMMPPACTERSSGVPPGDGALACAMPLPRGCVACAACALDLQQRKHVTCTQTTQRCRKSGVLVGYPFVAHGSEKARGTPKRGSPALVASSRPPLARQRVDSAGARCRRTPCVAGTLGAARHPVSRLSS